MNSSRYIQIVVRKKDGTINKMCHYPSYASEWFDKADFYLNDRWLSEWDSTYQTVLADASEYQTTGKYDFILTEKYQQMVGCEPIDCGIIVIDFQTKQIFSCQNNFYVGKRKITYIDSNFVKYRSFFIEKIINTLSYEDTDVGIFKTIDISHYPLSEIQKVLDYVRSINTSFTPSILQDIDAKFHHVSTLFFHITSNYWQIHEYTLHAKNIMKIRKILQELGFTIDSQEDEQWQRYINSISRDNIKNDISDIEFMYDYYQFFNTPFIFE